MDKEDNLQLPHKLTLNQREDLTLTGVTEVVSIDDTTGHLAGRALLAEKILSSTEREEYEQASDRNLALLKFWVLKEAQAKCTGEGLKGYPNHTNFTLDDPRVSVTDGCLVAILEE